ncbi:MAG: LysE family translocator [Actinomycetota bacterium]
MPDPGTLALFALSAVVLIAIPGPNLIYIVTRSLEQGRRAGMVSALGVETGTLVHVTAAAVGVSALIASSAVAFNIVRYLGAAYLFYLGIRDPQYPGLGLPQRHPWLMR